MPDVELTRAYAGGAAQPGDCGHIERENPDGTVIVTITRNKDCESIPSLTVPSVDRDHLKPCHCDD